MAIAAERLAENAQILVHGKISFSRLAKLIEGDALAKSIADSRKRGSLYPTETPHTTVSLVDAQIMPANPDGTLSLEEQYVAEKLYTIKSGENQGKQGYSIDNKSTYLPNVFEPDPENPAAHRQVVLERDLATGLDVILVLQTFSSKAYAKKGLGLQQVILREPVRYYASGGVDTSALAARGIVISGPVRSISGAEAAATVPDPAPAAGLPANSGLDANGFPAPLPGGGAPVAAPAPVQAPVAAPVAQAPVAAAPVAAPVAPVAPQGDSPEVAALKAQLLEAQRAAAHSGGASAFDGVAAPVAAPAAVTADDPWATTGQPSPTPFQG